MSEHDLSAGMYATVRGVTDRLTDHELLAINFAAQFGTNPRAVIGYDKASLLFTEQGGTRMHEDTRRILAAIVLERFPEAGR